MKKDLNLLVNGHLKNIIVCTECMAKINKDCGEQQDAYMFMSKFVTEQACELCHVEEVVKRESFYDKELVVQSAITVGELMEVLAGIPDDFLLLTTTDDGEAVNIKRVDTHWHGAVTLQGG
jgi:hypothetical protein